MFSQSTIILVLSLIFITIQNITFFIVPYNPFSPTSNLHVQSVTVAVVVVVV